MSVPPDPAPGAGTPPAGHPAPADAAPATAHHKADGVHGHPRQLSHDTLTDDQILRSLELGLTRLVSTGTIADTRASLILSTNLAMLGSMVALLPSANRMLSAGAWSIFWMVVALCAGSVALVAASAFPQTNSPHVRSIVFFGGIVSFTREAYLGRLKELTREDYAVDLSSQCHRVARIAAFKFRCVRIAMVLLLTAAPFWLTTLYLTQRIPVGL